MLFLASTPIRSNLLNRIIASLLAVDCQEDAMKRSLPDPIPCYRGRTSQYRPFSRIMIC